MEFNAEASTSSAGVSKRKRTRNDDVGLCGMSKDDYERILSCLDSDEEPYIDSGSEYEPDPNECETSDEEAEELVYGENEDPDEMELGQNDNVEADNSEIQEHNALKTVLSLNWDKTPFKPTIHSFDDTNSGALIESIEDKSNALSYFILFLNSDVVDLIVKETNRYASDNKENTKQKWKETTVNEIYVFLSVMLLTARHGKNNMKEHWSTDALLHTPIFSQVMPRNRFLSILSMLHFSNNADQKQGDSFHKIREVLTKMTSLFAKHFYPFANLVIDESLVLFKGRLKFKQYIKSKRHRFGIKLFLLCDCETGFVLDVIVYTGKTTDIEQFQDLGISGSVVAHLMKPYLEKGHSLYTDNWYTSPTLSIYLHEHKTNSCGTVRPNRKLMPNLTSKLNKGETVSMSSERLLAVKWKDRREVFILTSMHEDNIISSDKVDFKTKEPIKKPACVLDYNANMGAIDRSDMMLSSTECVRKTVKWYKKLFFHMVDLAMLNAHALYQTQNPGKEPLADFQLKVIRQLIERYSTPQSTQIKVKAMTKNPERLTGRHFPALVPNNKVRRCTVCGQTKLKAKKRSESRYMCAQCNVGLCVQPCFEVYHTKQTF